VWGEAFDTALRLAGAIGLPALLLWYLRDRKKTNAVGQVAERTVDAAVTKEDAGALEAHVLAVERAFEIERSSKDRTIVVLTTKVEEIERSCSERVQGLVDDLAQKDGLIASLRQELATVTESLAGVTAQVEVLQARLGGEGHP
jgi:hypothetical protein